MAGTVHPDDLAPPGWHRLREIAWHFPRLLAGLGPVGPRGPEDGPPALVLPGFLASDRTTMDCRRALARACGREPALIGKLKLLQVAGAAAPAPAPTRPRP